VVKKSWTWRDAIDHIPVYQPGLPTGYARGPFIADQLLDAARARVGLDDFGDPSFREGLDKVCEAYSADPELSDLGHFMGTEFLIGTLVRRLQIIDWYKSHPEVLDEVIDRPWIITGMTRSGSSLTSQLFDLDPQVRSPMTWEVDYPIPPAQLATRYSDPRIAACAGTLDLMAPAQKAMHPWDAMYPQECVLMTQMAFQSIMFQSVSLVPEYIEWMLNSDMRPAYRLHKQMLQIWQSAIPTAHWGLKAPAHMGAIDVVMETYPDARIIWNHRDPLVCIASHTSMTIECIKNPNLDPRKAAEHFKWQWWTALNKMMAYDKAQKDKSWCHHLYYRKLAKSPVDAIGAAYEHFGENLDPVHARSIETFLVQQPKDYHGKHVYDIEEMGLDPQQVRQQFAEYIETYEVPLEA
jgi:Sulfotransferase family